MVNYTHKDEGVLGIQCIDDQLVITIVDKDNDTDLQLRFSLDAAVDICRAIIYHTCMIGNGENILEIINQIISNVSYYTVLDICFF